MGLQRNVAQEEAIATINGPMILISCPGSGKTTTLIRRIKNIIDSGKNPQKILMITFAKTAAQDMEERFIQMYGKNPGVSFMTIHSLCFNILKYEGKYDKTSLISESQKMEFLVNQLKGNVYISDAWEMAKNIATEISLVKNNFIPLNRHNPKSCDKELFQKVYNAYETEKKHANKIDFDDMLSKCEDLLLNNDDARKRWGNCFDYIQVDEYQDTNHLQKEIIYSLIERTKNLCVVGDDDQSLYSWRGADPSIMMTFKEDFPDVKEIYMSVNYRSAQNIVNYADTLIQRNTKRFSKDFISQRGKDGAEGTVEYQVCNGKIGEMDYVIDKIQYLHEVNDIDYKDMSILFRTNKQIDIPVSQLSKAGIPFTSTEKINSMYDSYIYKDIKSYIELSMGVNTKSNLYAILNHPNRFLNIHQLKDVPFTKSDYLKAISYLRNSKDTWRYPAAEKSITGWMDAFGPNMVDGNTSPIEIFKRIENPKGVNYLKHLKSVAQMKNSDLQDELDIFNQLKADSKRFSTVESWFAHANYELRKTQELNRKKTANGVTLTTMHKSKGLEWKVVFAIGVDAGVLPGKQSTTQENIEEERRILYVAMTRAEDKLYVTSTGKPSPFMLEVEKDYKKRTNPNIKKKLPGSNVLHQTYGEGKVVRYVGSDAIINFSKGGLKKIPFPDAFQKGICQYI